MERPPAAPTPRPSDTAAATIVASISLTVGSLGMSTLVMLTAPLLVRLLPET